MFELVLVVISKVEAFHLAQRLLGESGVQTVAFHDPLYSVVAFAMIERLFFFFSAFYKVSEFCIREFRRDRKMWAESQQVHEAWGEVERFMHDIYCLVVTVSLYSFAHHWPNIGIVQ